MPWVYVLRNEKGHSYVGQTVNLERRLRQHNGMVSGGAKRTRAGRPWEVAASIYVAEKALSVEAAVKARRGLAKRVAAVVALQSL